MKRRSGGEEERRIGEEEERRRDEEEERRRGGGEERRRGGEEERRRGGEEERRIGVKEERRKGGGGKALFLVTQVLEIPAGGRGFRLVHITHDLLLIRLHYTPMCLNKTTLGSVYCVLSVGTNFTISHLYNMSISGNV